MEKIEKRKEERTKVPDGRDKFVQEMALFLKKDLPLSFRYRIE